MKIHPDVKDKDTVKKLARSVGLNKIKTKPLYSLHKTGSKNASPYGYVDQMNCGTGNVFIIGVEEYVWLAVIGVNTWFKTSPVLSCVKFDGGFKIETKNSHYELRVVY
jgi:hypothetical protein